MLLAIVAILVIAAITSLGIDVGRLFTLAISGIEQIAASS